MFTPADTPREIAAWTLVSAVLQQHTPHFPLRAGAAVRALGSFAGVDGEPVLAAGCGDGSVRLWSALSGEPLGDPPTGYSPVQGLAACEVGGGHGSPPEMRTA